MKEYYFEGRPAPFYDEEWALGIVKAAIADSDIENLVNLVNVATDFGTLFQARLRLEEEVASIVKSAMQEYFYTRTPPRVVQLKHRTTVSHDFERIVKDDGLKRQAVRYLAHALRDFVRIDHRREVDEFTREIQFSITVEVPQPIPA